MIWLLYLVLGTYYIVLPLVLGYFPIEGKNEIFICDGCADLIEYSFLLYGLAMFAISVLFLYVADSDRLIQVKTSNDAAIKVLTNFYIIVSSCALIVLGCLDFNSYMSDQITIASKLIYTIIEVFIGPAVFLMISGVVKPKKLTLIIVTIGLLVVLARLKRLELFIMILALVLALYKNNRVSMKKVLIAGFLLVVVGSFVGYIRSVIRGDMEVDYYGMLWESTFVFRSFLVTVQTNYIEQERIYSDFVSGLILAVPEVFRSLMFNETEPFDLTAWGGDNYIRPLGGHHVWAQFYQAAGWFGLLIPPSIISAILLFFRFFRNFISSNVVCVGVLMIGIALVHSFRDHFYMIFRILSYWFLIWVLPYLMTASLIQKSKAKT